ncbi:EAL domain-containing protein [Citrobacter braakii]|uniref:EAL domain-containing protein n=1 Tax=Citrobacter braakii TaxID=57706 RepID=UPI002B2495A0|nr:EAL domain-containing protein [Citrobacter braakii]MEB2307514.1 EAL domain-containing protein [Citrobacter braakii]
MAAQRFIPCFQPLHDAVSGKPVGAEMLARMELPDGRVVSPAIFLPYVMAAGKITVMTQILLQKTSDWLRTVPFTLSFNVLPDMTGEAWLKDACGKMLQASGGNVAVVIELTECTPLTLPRQTLLRSLVKLMQAGVFIKYSSQTSVSELKTMKNEPLWFCWLIK